MNKHDHERFIHDASKWEMGRDGKDSDDTYYWQLTTTWYMCPLLQPKKTALSRYGDSSCFCKGTYRLRVCHALSILQGRWLDSSPRSMSDMWKWQRGRMPVWACWWRVNSFRREGRHVPVFDWDGVEWETNWIVIAEMEVNTESHMFKTFTNPGIQIPSFQPSKKGLLWMMQTPTLLQKRHVGLKLMAWLERLFIDLSSTTVLLYCQSHHVADRTKIWQVKWWLNASQLNLDSIKAYYSIRSYSIWHQLRCMPGRQEEGSSRDRRQGTDSPEVLYDMTWMINMNCQWMV